MSKNKIYIVGSGWGSSSFVKNIDTSKYEVTVVSLSNNFTYTPLLANQVKDENNPHGDIEIEFTGLREGEKLYEELLIGDNVKRTVHKYIMSAVEEKLSYNEVLSYIEKFRLINPSTSSSDIKKILQESIGSSFASKGNVIDIKKNNPES